MSATKETVLHTTKEIRLGRGSARPELTVGELRKAIEGIDDNVTVYYIAEREIIERSITSVVLEEWTDGDVEDQNIILKEKP